jgi:hypothetical protein
MWSAGARSRRLPPGLARACSSHSLTSTICRSRERPLVPSAADESPARPPHQLTPPSRGDAPRPVVHVAHPFRGEAFRPRRRSRPARRPAEPHAAPLPQKPSRREAERKVEGRGRATNGGSAERWNKRLEARFSERWKRGPSGPRKAANKKRALSPGLLVCKARTPPHLRLPPRNPQARRPELHSLDERLRFHLAHPFRGEAFRPRTPTRNHATPHRRHIASPPNAGPRSLWPLSP